MIHLTWMTILAAFSTKFATCDHYCLLVNFAFMNFFGQSGKILITPNSESNPGCSASCTGQNQKRGTKFAKDNEVVVPIELVGYRSYRMEPMEVDKERETQLIEGREQDDQQHQQGAEEELALMELDMATHEEETHEVHEHENMEEVQEDEEETPLFERGHSPDSVPIQSSSSSTHFQSPPVRSVQKYKPWTDETRRIQTFTKNRTNIQILQAFLNFGYYIGLIPFRYQTTDRLRWKLRFYECKPQRVFCAFVHMLIICFGANKWTDPELYTIFSPNPAPRAEYLKFVLAISETLYTHLLILILWSKKPTFNWLAENYPVQNLVQPIHGRYHKFLTALQNRFFLSTLLILLFIPVGLNLFLSEYNQIDPDEEALFGEDGYIIRQAQAFIFIDPDNEEVQGRVVHPVVSHIAATLYVFGGFMYAMLFGVAHLFTCVVALLVYDVGSHFVKQLKAGQLTAGQGVELYERVKNFMEIVNDSFGFLILLIVLTIIPYIGKNVPVLASKSEPWSTKLGALVIVVNFGLFLWCGTNFIAQIKRFRGWLGKHANQSNEAQLPNSRVQSIYSELTDDPVGLSGCGLFTVSYAFTGALIQLLFIYAFIAISAGAGARQGQEEPGLTIGNGTGSGSDVPELSFVE